eukprot:evm.model.scf_2106.2 EVM.evm.TU.scf_2106.2   scf_2106:1553-16817(-)
MLRFQILLLEAYEQLEMDVEKEVQRAVAGQTADFERQAKRNKALEEELQCTRARCRALDEHLEHLQESLDAVQERNRMYEEGIYGLVEAMEEISSLKARLDAAEKRQEELVSQANLAMDSVETLADENRVLRAKANVPEEEAVDISHLKIEKDAAILQLRSLTAQLETEVWNLEEERRKLKTELRFRAKYQGRQAADMGLTPEQVLRVEQYVDRLKHGAVLADTEEDRFVEELMQRVRILEDRLAQAQAYADLPPNMRPSLVDLPPHSTMDRWRSQWESEVVVPIKEAISQLQKLGPLEGTAHTAIKDEQVCALVAAFSTPLDMAGKLLDTAKAEALLLPGADAGKTQCIHSDFELDVLKQKLQSMVEKAAGLDLELAKKDIELSQLKQNIGSGDCQATPQAEEEATNRSIGEAHSMAALKLQLVELVEEVDKRNAENRALVLSCEKYRRQMGAFFDQRALLYAQHVSALRAWKKEKLGLEKKMQEMKGEIDSLRAYSSEVERGIENMAQGCSVKESLAEAVRRAAIVQMKHVRIARELETSRELESAMSNQCRTMESAADNVTCTYKALLRNSRHLTKDLSRRLEGALSRLEASVPCQVFNAVQQKYVDLQRCHRELVEEYGNRATLHDKGNVVYDELVSYWISKFLDMSDTSTRFSEENLELKRGLENSTNADCASSALQVELVELRVKEQNACRRVEVADRAKERAEESLVEALERAKHMDNCVAELSARLDAVSRSKEDRDDLLASSVSRERFDDLYTRWAAADERCAKLELQVSTLEESAEVDGSRVATLRIMLKRHHAEIVNLKGALREAAGHGDKVAAIARLQLELEHVRDLEALARCGQLQSNSERDKLMLEVNHMAAAVAQAKCQSTAMAEELRCVRADRQRLISDLKSLRAGLVERWRAELWTKRFALLESSKSTLSQNLHNIQARVKEMEQQRDKVIMTAEAVDRLSDLMSQPAPEIYKALADRQEKLLTVQVENARLERAMESSRTKVSYLERTNADLQSVVSHMEGETVKQLSQLASDNEAACAEGQQLQNTISKLSKENETLSVELAAMKELHDSARSTELGAREEQAAGTAADRELMLRQIEKVKDARLEVKTYRQQCDGLQRDLFVSQGQLEHLRKEYNDLLERLQQGSEVSLSNPKPSQDNKDAAVSQVQAMAESTIKELREQVIQKELRFKELHIRLENDREVYLRQHNIDRREIQRLSSRLLEGGRTSIEQLKGALSHPTSAHESAHHDPVDGGNESYEQLKHMLEEREAQVTLLTTQVKQLEENLDEQQLKHHRQMAAVGEDVEALKAELASAQELINSGEVEKGWREAERKLRLQIASKDVKLRQLKDAIKALEQRLVDALKQTADETMHESSWREQEVLDERIAALRVQRATAVQELERCQLELSTVQHELEEKGEELRKLKCNTTKSWPSSKANQIQGRGQYKANRASACQESQKPRELAPGPQDVVEKLEKTIGDLSAQNKRLQEQNRLLHEKASREAVRKNAPIAHGGDAGKDTGSDAEHVLQLPARQDLSIQQWEENKRLQKKIENLRTLVNKKNQELMQTRKELERLHLHTEEQHKAAIRQSNSIRSLQEELKQSKEALKQQPGAAKFASLLEKLNEVEEEKGRLELQVARQGRDEAHGSQRLEEKKKIADEDLEAALILKEEEAFEAALQRDQAEAHVHRLKQRMHDLFGNGESTFATASPCRTPLESSSRRGKQISGTERERELLATVNTLKKALEKSQAGVPPTKYRQAVEKRKEAQARAKELASEVQRLSEKEVDVQHLKQKIDELQTSNLVLRRQVVKLQDVTAKLDEAQQAMNRKDAELAALRKALASVGSHPGESPDTHQETVQPSTSSEPELAAPSETSSALRRRVRELEEENEFLQNELDAFDPEFFEEIEALKREHQELSEQVRRYEHLVQ